MTKRGFPLNDQDVSVAQWSAMARHWRSSGVIEDFLLDLEVFGDSSGRQVKVRSGAAFARGHYFDSDATETIALAANSSGNPRRDLIVIRADTGVVPSTIDFAVIQGTPAASPATPTPVDTSTQYDVPLGYATVANGAVTIAAGDVTDQRWWALPANAPVAYALISTVGGVAFSTGIASLTDLATGRFQVTWQRPFTRANTYGVLVTAQSSGVALVATVEDSAKTTTACEFRTWSTAGALADPQWIMIAAWGT